MKEIKDYLHLYLGCEVSTPVEPITRKLFFTGIRGNDCHVDTEETIGRFSGGFNYRPEKLKPILRPLSDMTEEEGIGYAQLFCANKIPDNCTVNIKKHESGGLHVSIKSGSSELSLFPGGSGDKPEAFRYILSKHFDLFGLIESGLAIDKSNKTIKT